MHIIAYNKCIIILHCANPRFLHTCYFFVNIFENIIIRKATQQKRCLNAPRTYIFKFIQI